MPGENDINSPVSLQILAREQKKAQAILADRSPLPTELQKQFTGLSIVEERPLMILIGSMTAEQLKQKNVIRTIAKKLAEILGYQKKSRKSYRAEGAEDTIKSVLRAVGATLLFKADMVDQTKKFYGTEKAVKSGIEFAIKHFPNLQALIVEGEEKSVEEAHEGVNPIVLFAGVTEDFVEKFTDLVQSFTDNSSIFQKQILSARDANSLSFTLKLPDASESNQTN